MKAGRSSCLGLWPARVAEIKRLLRKAPKHPRIAEVQEAMTYRRGMGSVVLLSFGKRLQWGVLMLMLMVCV